MNRPSDAKVRAAVQSIFNVQGPDQSGADNSIDLSNKEESQGLNLFENESSSNKHGLTARVEAQFKSRDLLHHWPLSRVERLTFRSADLPTIIFKAMLAPLQGELDLYQDLFRNDNRWSPILYGSTHMGEEVWLFLEDVGTRTFKNEPTSDNLQRVTNTLAGMHVAFGREVATGSLQQRSHLIFAVRCLRLPR